MKTNTTQSTLILLFIIILTITGILIINYCNQSKKEQFTVNNSDLIKKIADRISECFGGAIVRLDDEELNALNVNFFIDNHNEILLQIQRQIKIELTKKYKTLHQFIANEYCDKKIHADRYSKFEEKYQEHMNDLYNKVTCTALYLKRIYYILEQTTESAFNSINPKDITLDETQLTRVKYQLTCIQRLTIPINNTLISKTQDIRGFVEEIYNLITKLASNLICTSAGQDNCYDYCGKNQPKNPAFKNPLLFNPMIPVPTDSSGNETRIETLYINLARNETLRCEPAKYTGPINIGLGEDSSYSSTYSASSSSGSGTSGSSSSGSSSNGSSSSGSSSSGSGTSSSSSGTSSSGSGTSSSGSGTSGSGTSGSSSSGSSSSGSRTSGSASSYSGTSGSASSYSGTSGSSSSGSGTSGSSSSGSGSRGSGSRGSGSRGSGNPRRTQSPPPEDDDYEYDRHRRTHEYEGSPDYISDNYEITFSQPNIHLENSKGPNNFFIPNIWIEEYQTV